MPFPPPPGSHPDRTKALCIDDAFTPQDATCSCLLCNANAIVLTPKERVQMGFASNSKNAVLDYGFTCRENPMDFYETRSG